MKPARGLLLVQPLDTEERIGSLIVPETARERMTAHQCEVVAVGAPELCEDEDCERQHLYGEADESYAPLHACPVQIGAWLIVRPRSLLDAGALDGKLWLVRQRDVLAIVSDDGTPS